MAQASARCSSELRNVFDRNFIALFQNLAKAEARVSTPRACCVNGAGGARGATRTEISGRLLWRCANRPGPA